MEEGKESEGKEILKDYNSWRRRDMGMGMITGFFKKVEIEKEPSLYYTLK